MDKTGVNRSVILELPFGILDIAKTFECGQCFRWNRLNDGTYTGIVGDSLIFIKKLLGNESKDKYIVYSSEMSIDEFVNYLDIPTNYSLPTAEYTDFEKKAINFGTGIRILNQDIWETVVSFIISQRNNIPKIKTTIEKLCISFGDRCTAYVNGKEYIYHKFPNRNQILKAGIDGLDKCGLGYRSKYILKLAEDYDCNKFKNYNNLNTDELCEELQGYYGIGPKVANCIALFGYHRLEAFPIDVWIQRIIDIEYNGSIDTAKFGSLAGLMQQYMFYYINNKTGEIK